MTVKLKIDYSVIILEIKFLALKSSPTFLFRAGNLLPILQEDII